MNAYNPILSPEVGDVVLYRGAFGLGPATRAVVMSLDTNKGQDIVSLDDGHWAYLRQIEAICSHSVDWRDIERDPEIQKMQQDTDDEWDALNRGPEPMLDKP